MRGGGGGVEEEGEVPTNSTHAAYHFGIGPSSLLVVCLQCLVAQSELASPA